MRRDLLLLIGAFAALAALIGLGPGQAGSGPGESASSHVSGPEGGLALYRWLAALDYEVERLEYADFTPEGADMLVVLAPTERYDDEAAALVRAWVEAGGTLLVAEPRPGRGAPSAPLLAAFGLAIERAPDEFPSFQAPALQPVLGAPAVTALESRSATMVVADDQGVAALAGSSEAPILVGRQVGAGYVFASAAVYPFTNEGLRSGDHGALMLNLLRRIPPGGVVRFDEIHHGFVGEQDLRGLLLGNPWGWATLYGVVVGAGFLILTGRRFGRPMPLRAEAARRGSDEYLGSMAGLLRRAGKGAYVQRHFHAGLKRRLARANGLNPDLGDQELVAALAQTRPTDARAAAALLARLGGPPVDEKTLLVLVREADGLLEK